MTPQEEKEASISESKPINTWALKKFEIEFKKGYSHENSVDRYEAKVQFHNEKGEQFNVNISKEASDKMMELIRPQILETAQTLIKKLS